MASRPMSKRELDDIKKKDDLKRSAEVFSEFIEAFEETDTPAKKFTAFVRGGVVKPGTGEEHHGGDQADRMYVHKPTITPSSKPAQKSSRFAPELPKSSSHSVPAPSVTAKPALPKKEKEKKKSNLEIFKEELKQIQEEREERKRLKDQISKIETKLGVTATLPPSSTPYVDDDYRVFDGTYDLSGEVGSTNLYMGNLAPQITEEQLCEVFGRYGPIASVKIMYPRGEDKEEVRASGRTTLCGFVAFMSRIDAERAMANLRGKDVVGYEMRLGWGKSVNVPAFPLYVPPRLKELLEPPPYSGLPFNAQPAADDAGISPDNVSDLPPEKLMEILGRSVVRVCQPQDRALLLIVHRVIEFVIREGAIFEAMLMQREKDNPQYRFLFDNRCNEHTYYRWKLFSLLQGDTPTQWRTKDFQMFDDGPTWKPPPISMYTNGMPEELVREERPSKLVKNRDGRADSVPKESSTARGAVSEETREELTKMLNELTPSRDSIADGMVFCLDHADSADEVIGAICTSLANTDPPLKKLAKIYLISDILHNCSGVHVQNAWYFRNGFEQKFPFVFTQIRNSHKSFEGRLKAEHYKQRVMNCFRAWEDWALYPPKYLIHLQNIFLGLEPGEDEEEPLDGKPIEMSPEHVVEVKRDADLDGLPLEEDLDGAPLDDLDDINGGGQAVGFAPSRWETLDPEQVKAQAITTSKWEQVEERNASTSGRNGGKTEGKSLDDHVREQLREIEMRVMSYQDDLETGKRSRHAGESVAAQVAKYRKQLMTTPSSTSKADDRKRERKGGEKSSREAEREKLSVGDITKKPRIRSRSRSRGSRDTRSPPRTVSSRLPAKRSRSRSKSRERDRIRRH